MLDTVLEALGVLLIAAFAATFAPRWALLVGGLWLILTALSRDRSRQAPDDGPGKSPGQSPKPGEPR